jgi:hypothetical protein
MSYTNKNTKSNPLSTQTAMSHTTKTTKSKRKVDKSKVKKIIRKYTFRTILDEEDPYYMIDMERLFDVELVWQNSMGVAEFCLLGTRKSIRKFIDMYKEHLEDGSSLYYTTKGERKYYWGKEW